MAIYLKYTGGEATMIASPSPVIQRRTGIGSDSGETAEPMIRVVDWSRSGQTEAWQDAERADELPPDIAISIPFEVMDQMAAMVAACRGDSHFMQEATNVKAAREMKTEGKA
jgi:hypothetical protein